MRVLVVDDTVIYRKIISQILKQIEGVECVGVAADGKIALEKVQSLQPDLITLDLEMPGMDGLEVIRCLRQAGSNVGIIMLSAFTTEGAEVTIKALEMGAFDFVVKPSGGAPEENVAKLRRQLGERIKAFARQREIQRILYAPASDSPASWDTAVKPPRNISTGTSESVSLGARAASSPHVVSEIALWQEQPQVVAIGISTGGPQALMYMLPQLPADLLVPVLIVQHMPALFTRSLAEDLNNRCPLEVCEAEDGQTVAPGTIYIAPGGRQMKVQRSDELPVIRITDDPPENSCRPSVDYLFRSVAEVYGHRTVGVIMTGLGNDGAAGCRLLHRCGARLLAQDEASCVVFGMPREPVLEGIAPAVPLKDMAQHIIRLAGRRELQLASKPR